MNTTAEELLLEFIFQNSQIAKNAGVKSTQPPSWPRAVKLWGHHMSAIAKIVENWDIPPSIIMQAAFDQAKRNKHPDGPQVTMLKSDKYLTNALSFYLNMPVAYVREKKSMAMLQQILDKEFSEVNFPPDLLSFTVENVCFRYVEARRRGEDVVAAVLAPEVLKQIQADRRLDMWVDHRGYPFMDIASHYHAVGKDLMLPQIDTDNL